MKKLTRSINHVAFAVADMARAKQILVDCFGLAERLERRTDNDQMSVVFLGGNSMDVELLYFKDADARPLVHVLTPHLAFDVADLEAAVAALGEKGVVLQSSQPTQVLDTQNVWTTPESTGGLVIQLVMHAAESRATTR
jgi:catechol 2,3-dioxygenase-like lactoylglutathione lyase family enzyme